MDDAALDAAIRSVLGTTTQRPDDTPQRAQAIGRLFAAYRDPNLSLADHYVRATWDIPLYWLCAAIAVIERSRVYPSLPTTGELWTTARRTAGMHREQYQSGRYLPPPQDWPPAGQRYAVTAGCFEAVESGAVPALSSGARLSLPERSS